MTLLDIFYVFFGLIVAFVAVVYLKIIRPQKRSYDLFRAQGVPCEPFIPLFGQMFDVIRANRQNKDLEYFNQLAQKHGYHFLLSLGPLQRLFVLEPELLADVLSRSKAEYYGKTSFLINIIKPVIGEHNLLLSKHDEHERARLMLNPAFHSVNLRSMVPIMTNETAKTIQTLITTSSGSIRLDRQISVLTLSIIASSAFGQSFERVPHAKKLISDSFDEAKHIIEYRTLRMINQVKFLDELPFWGKEKIEEAKRKLDDFVNQAILDRRNGNSSSLCSGQDILDLLISAVDQQGQPFTDEQIRDEAVTFVLAGHETTSNLLTWALYAMMLDENVFQACREEVDRVLPNQTVPTYEHLSDLQVIEAVLYETLRLYPAAPVFGRQSLKEHTISSSDGRMKLFIPVGTMIVISTYVLHRREDYWPRPLEFDYKRWMRNPTTGLKPKLSHPFAYLPFAAGPRNCIGQNFAILEAKVILAMLVQHCTFKLVPGQIIAPHLNGVTMPPKYGLLGYVQKRDLH